jgi:urea transporter
MKPYLSGWESLCETSTFLRFIDSNLRGIGQVMFQDNPLSGALFLAAIVWGAVAAGMPNVAICGVIAVVVSTLTAQVLRVDQAMLRSGLYGFNGVLVGLALATFIAPGPLLWAYVVLGAALSVVTMSATASALKALGLPTLTFPFVIVTWLLLLASYGFAGLGGDALPAEDVVPPYESVDVARLGVVDFLHSVLLSISQVFLKASIVAALLFLAGLAVNSVAAAVAAVAGAILAVGTAHVLGAESDLITGGLLGFSPVLTAVALGTVFHPPGVRVAVYAALGTICTVIAQSAFNVALAPLAIPALTWPFVLITWLFLLPRQNFDPAASPAAVAQAKDIA